MASKKKQNFYYVMVMTNCGPVFVTAVEYVGKTAHWNKNEKPLEMGKYQAEDLTLGLNLNFHLAFTVCSKFELDTQPYMYNLGEFEWKFKNEKNEENEQTA